MAKKGEGMSYEGYIQHICKRGHYWEESCYSDGPELCPECGSKKAWSNSVDITNGSYEDGKRIDGYKQPKLISTTYCEHCKTVTERLYEIPRAKKRKG